MIEIKQNELITGVLAGITAGAILILSGWITKIIYGENQSVIRVSFEIMAPFVILLCVVVYLLYKMSKRPKKKSR
ncbi:MAG: hypothetical protein Q8Q01_04810 [archaeon]|nr:hypothetical protein [archaeon]